MCSGHRPNQSCWSPASCWPGQERGGWVGSGYAGLGCAKDWGLYLGVGICALWWSLREYMVCIFIWWLTCVFMHSLVDWEWPGLEDPHGAHQSPVKSLIHFVGMWSGSQHRRGEWQPGSSSAVAFKFWGDLGLLCTSRLPRKAVQACTAGVRGWWHGEALVWCLRAGVGREEKAFMGKQRSYSESHWGETGRGMGGSSGLVSREVGT